VCTNTCRILTEVVIRLRSWKTNSFWSGYETEIKSVWCMHWSGNWIL